MIIINKTANVQHRSIKGVRTALKRIWLEGKRLGDLVVPGTPMRIKDTSDGIQVTFNTTDAQRTVSRRNNKGVETPIIEINEVNSEFLKTISNDTILRIEITNEGILIEPNKEVVGYRIHERESRIIKKSKNKETIEIGSVFAGGGTFDFCGEQGFKKSGLSTVVRLAIDYDEGAVDNLLKNVSHVFDEKSIIIQSDISLINVARDRIPKLDVLKITPPCVDASPAGKAKKGNKVETSKTAHLVYYYSQLIDQTNPAYIIMENVEGFQNEASFLVVKALIENWGYTIQMRVINSNEEGFSLEARKRMFMVAESNGLVGHFNIDEVASLRTMPEKLSDILDEYADDDPVWKSKAGLIKKEESDIKAKKGFKMQIFDGSESHINTLRAMYAKSGSTDPLIVNKNTGMYRILNKNEHARAKNIDEALVDGLFNTKGHMILGNGLVGSVAEALCFQLGKSIQQL